MSASDVDQPRLSRTAAFASSPPNPMASSTWDGCTLPEEQADPEETAIPARSKPITAVSALRPGAANNVVLGNRWTPSENTLHAAFRGIPGVRAVHVAMVPGSEPVLAAGVAADLTSAALRTALRGQLAAWKLPERIVVMPSLPISLRGKVDRLALEKILSEPCRSLKSLA